MYSFQDFWLPDQSTLDKDRCNMENSILNLALEIIYLLTGEEYTTLKTSSECVTPSNHGHESGERGKCQSPKIKPPPNSLIYDSNTAQKILELTNKIREVLTAEVPIKCQDVAIYLSMEEWEYLDGHKDLYKDVMMEDHQPLMSPDASGKPKRPKRCPSPIYFQECSEEKQINQGREPTDIKDEVVEEETSYVSGDQQCKEEQSPTDIRLDDCKEESKGHFLTSPDEKAMFDDIQDNSREHTIRSKLPSLCHSGDLSSDSEQPSVAHSQTTKQISSHRGDHTFGRCEGNIDSKETRDSNTEETLFSCSECRKCFKQKSRLVQHQKIHTGEKPYSCLECSKCFKQKSYLAQHQRIHTGENLFSCLECGKRFTQRLGLVEHQRIHTGEKPFSCLECGKTFTTKSNFLKHQRNHQREKPFSCHKCETCFTFKSELVKHQKIHGEEKPFSCSECDKSFTQKEQLVKHQKHHKGHKPLK
ncbi:uncharacterized protein ACNLHF_020591 isoform 2-T2 [Anomaloglossus baeobatrachus]|uniref:uncharacterized protein LOC142311127 isoform X2 n=1 Tax=Anomaloglossus baeobatrachus TaxID=238106 RepID=UPI003F4F462E